MALKININRTSNLPIVIAKQFNIRSNSEYIYARIAEYKMIGKTGYFKLYFFDEIIEEIEGEQIATLVPLNIPVKEFELVINEDENSSTIRSQAYEYLKTLPEFADCEDC